MTNILSDPFAYKVKTLEDPALTREVLREYLMALDCSNDAERRKFLLDYMGACSAGGLNFDKLPEETKLDSTMTVFLNSKWRDKTDKYIYAIDLE